MDQWFVPSNMIGLARQTTTTFGYDKSGSISYCFNSQGFRSPEPTNLPTIAIIGNSISFGIGLPAEQTFGIQLCQLTGRSLDNKSFGCYLHENHDHLRNIDLLSKQNKDLVFLLQINNLDRRRQDNAVLKNNDPSWCVGRFLEYFDQVEQMLKSRPHIYLYWDDKEYNIPETVQKKIAIKNIFHADTSIAHNANTFGAVSNRAIAKCVYSLLRANKHL